jgi:hypothetical protein
MEKLKRQHREEARFWEKMLLFYPQVVGSMANGIFMRDVTTVFTTIEGENVTAKGVAVDFP